MINLIFYVNTLAKVVAEDAPKILVARHGHQAAGVGRHADERGEKPIVGNCIEVVPDSQHVIIEPPSGTHPPFRTLVLPTVIMRP